MLPEKRVGDTPLHGDDDDREIQIEGEGAPPKKAKIGTLKAEANTLAALVHASLSESVL